MSSTGLEQCLCCAASRENESLLDCSWNRESKSFSGMWVILMWNSLPPLTPSEFSQQGYWLMAGAEMSCRDQHLAVDPPTEWPQHQYLLEGSGLQQEAQVWTSSRWWGSSRQRSPGRDRKLRTPTNGYLSVVKSVSRGKGLGHQADTGWGRTPALGEDQGYCAGYQNKALEGREDNQAKCLDMG